MGLPGKRLIQLLAWTAPLWLLAGTVPFGWIIGAGAILALLAVAWRNGVLEKKLPALQVRRILPSRFALGEIHSIELVLYNPSHRDVTLQLRDEFPEALQQMENLSEVTIPPFGKASSVYSVRAIRRGRHRFANLVVRRRTGIGLVQREYCIPLPVEIRIYPRFHGVDSFDLLAKIDRRDEWVRKPRRTHGQGTDFESLRPYMPGEDLRNVDWKATAKRGALISRNRQIEKGQQVAVLIDCGRLMGEVMRDLTRLDHALNAAVMLGYVVQHRGDTLSVACFSNRLESFLPAVRGAGVVSQLMDTVYAVEPREVESDYWQVTAEVMGLLRRRSLVIMLTDVVDAVASRGLMNNLERAAGKHLVLCVVLKDPRLEETANRIPDGSMEAYQKASACDLLRRRRLALEHMRSNGILVLETEPERLSIQLVRRYLDIRKANLQ